MKELMSDENAHGEKLTARLSMRQ